MLALPGRWKSAPPTHLSSSSFVCCPLPTTMLGTLSALSQWPARKEPSAGLTSSWKGSIPLTAPHELNQIYCLSEITASRLSICGTPTTHGSLVFSAPGQAGGRSPALVGDQSRPHPTAASVSARSSDGRHHVTYELPSGWHLDALSSSASGQPFRQLLSLAR